MVDSGVGTSVTGSSRQRKGQTRSLPLTTAVGDHGRLGGGGVAAVHYRDVVSIFTLPSSSQTHTPTCKHTHKQKVRTGGEVTEIDRGEA